jgi:flavodoxin I
MKSLVVYSSQTGNTKKLAETVYDVLPAEKEIHALTEAPEPTGYDLVALGFWFKGEKPDPGSLEYLPKLAGKSLFLFATHGASEVYDHVAAGIEQAKSLAGGAKIIGTFSCQGEVNPKVLEAVRAKEKEKQPVWIERAEEAIGHPDESDIQRLKEAVAAALNA